MKRIAVFVSLLASLCFLGTGAAFAGPLQYQVTITNLTKGEPFSPTAVIIHDAQMEPIFTLGEPASEGIWSIAEGGNTAPLVAALSGNPHVIDIQVAGDAPYGPGESRTVILDGGNGFGGLRISLAGMLGITNDSFFALNGETVPNFVPFYYNEYSQVFMAPAYDSGTEVNNEDCNYVAGCGGTLRMTDGAEGYVYVSSGIHGIGDLDPAELDWNNPVAKITVRVSRHGF
jgi:hypothetical protein